MKFPSPLRAFILTAVTLLLTGSVSAGPLDAYRGADRLIIISLPPDVDAVPSSEALRLSVVGKVVLVVVGDDLGGQGWSQQGAGDRGKLRGLYDGRAGLVGFVEDLIANGAPPEDFGLQCFNPSRFCRVPRPV